MLIWYISDGNVVLLRKDNKKEVKQ